MVTWLETPFWVGTMTWLPAVLWAYVAALHRRRWSYVAASGLALGLAALAGQFQFLLVLLGLLAFLSISFALRGPRRFDPWPLVVFLAMATLGLAIGAVQIWPFAEFLPMTRRSLDDATVGGGSAPLPLAQLITLLVPDAFGNPARNDTYWGFANFSEATIYVGTATLLLALLGVAAKPRFWPLVLTAAVIGVLYVATGGPGVAALTSLPLVRGVAVHRVIFLLPLLIGWLAAIGLDRRDVRIRTIIAGAALIAGFHRGRRVSGGEVGESARTPVGRPARGGRRHQPYRRIAGCWPSGAQVGAGLRCRPSSWSSIGNLFWFGSSFNPTGRVDELMPPTPTAEYLAAQPGLQRVIALQRNGELLFGPNTLANYGLDDPAGYSSLVIRRYHDLVAAADPEIDNHWIDRQMNFILFSYPSERLLDMLNVGYLVAPEVIFDPARRRRSRPGSALPPRQPLRPASR